MNMKWFDESWGDAIQEFTARQPDAPQPIELGVVSKRPLVGFVVEPRRVVACLWGTEHGVGDFDGLTDAGFRGQGLGEALARAYVAEYRDRVSHFQAEPINDTSRRLLRKLGFTPQKNGQWILTTRPPA